MKIATLVIAVATPWVAEARAQSIAQRVAAVRDGVVELRYASRPGLCGDGGRSFSFGGTMWMGEMTMRDGRMEQRVCVPGPVRALIQMEEGAVRDIRVLVGEPRVGEERETRDLGVVSAASAADYFLQLAERDGGRVSNRAITAAVLADSASVWRRLLAIAHDDASRSKQTRKEAMFWLGQFAAAKLEGRPEQLGSDGGDHRDDARSSAVFALSQLRNREGIEPLVQVARTSKEAHLRRTALFWLGDSGDPRAVALFGEILGR